MSKRQGRPPIYDPDVILPRVYELMREGMSIASILKLPEMPSSQVFFKWKAGDPQIASDYARAREDRADLWAEEILTIADDSSGDWVEFETPDGRVKRRLDSEHVRRSRLKVDARKWLVSKHHPRTYGDRVAVDLDAKVDLETLTDEQLMARTKAAFQAMGIETLPELLPLIPGAPADTTPSDDD